MAPWAMAPAKSTRSRRRALRHVADLAFLRLAADGGVDAVRPPGRDEVPGAGHHPLLVDEGGQQDAAGERPLVGDGPGGEHRRDQAGLHVGAAPAVQATVADLAPERVHRPGVAVALGDDVGVALEHERRARSPTLDDGVHVGAPRRDRVDLGRPAERAELVGDEAGRALLAAPGGGVVHARDLDEGLDHLDEGFVVDAPIAPCHAARPWGAIGSASRGSGGGVPQAVGALGTRSGKRRSSTPGAGRGGGWPSRRGPGRCSTRRPRRCCHRPRTVPVKDAAGAQTVGVPSGRDPPGSGGGGRMPRRATGRLGHRVEETPRCGKGTDQSPASGCSGSARQIGWWRNSAIGSVRRQGLTEPAEVAGLVQAVDVGADQAPRRRDRPTHASPPHRAWWVARRRPEKRSPLKPPTSWLPGRTTSGQAVRRQQLPGEVGLPGVVGVVGGDVAGVHDEVGRVGGQPGEDGPHVGYGVGHASARGGCRRSGRHRRARCPPTVSAGRRGRRGRGRGRGPARADGTGSLGRSRTRWRPVGSPGAPRAPVPPPLAGWCRLHHRRSSRWSAPGDSVPGVRHRSSVRPRTRSTPTSRRSPTPVRRSTARPARRSCRLRNEPSSASPPPPGPPLTVMRTAAAMCSAALPRPP